MFTFLNKKDKKNVISSKIIGTDAFIERVEPIVLDRWADKTLAEKIGVAPIDLFSGTAKVNNTLSYEDACDCLTRIVVMFKVDAYVQEHFNDELDSIEDRAAKEQFCDLSTVLRLIDEAKTNINKNIDMPQDTSEAIDRINAYLVSLAPIKNITLRMVLMSVMVNYLDMTATI